MVISTTIESEGIIDKMYKLIISSNENNEYCIITLELPDGIAWYDDAFLYYHVFRVLKGKNPKIKKNMNIDIIPLEHRTELLEMFKKAEQLGFFNKTTNIF